jgi:hypothetical protein
LKEVINFIFKQPKIWLIIISLMIISSVTVHCDTNKNIIVKNNRFSAPIPEHLKEKLKNVQFYDDAVALITKLYGEPHRYLGSGDPAPQWDIEGGFLTCSYSLGVTYSKQSNFDIFADNTIYLIDTANRVDENLVRTYWLYTLPREKSLWIGNLELKADGQYLSDIKVKEPSDNFFLNHPAGTYTIEYQPGIKRTDLLENMRSGAILAEINFLAKNKSESYSLYFCIEGRGIVSKPTDNRNSKFEIIGSWKNSYYKLTEPRILPSFAIFREQIKNADSSREAYKIILKTYGEAQRTTQSSEAVWFEWDVEGGVLFYNLHNGVSYEKMGQRIYLIDTQNKVEKTIIDYYALCTIIPGDKDKIGNFLGVGLTLETNGKYKLETFGRDILKKGNQNEVFFYQYPSGTYIFNYQKGINSDDLLENIKDGTVLGKIDFASGTSRDSFYICIKERHLVFKPVDGKPRTYTLVRYWNNYYQKNDDQ